MSVSSLNRRGFILSAASAAVAFPAFADPKPAPTSPTSPSPTSPLAAPAGKPILSITGKIAITNADGVAIFDRDMLEGLGLTGFTTRTPWYDTPMTFEGVRLDRLMAAIGASGERLMARALDDYTTEIPIADFAAYRPILALRRNGEYMVMRDKGPLFIVYPYDSNPELQHQRFYSRSAWQVAHMIIS